MPAVRKIILACLLGILFGLFLGLPPALGATALGLTWTPYGFALVALGLLTGFLVTVILFACFTDWLGSLVRRWGRKKRMQTRPDDSPAGSIRDRLAREKARLDRIDGGRLGKAAADRIIWRELLELELQDIDERMNRTNSS